MAPEIVEAETSLKEGVLRYFKDPGPGALEDLYIPVTTLSSLYKHWGFHEEHEVRVVAIPAHRLLVAATSSDKSQRPGREIKTFLRDGCFVPFIELFRLDPVPNSPQHLPINRIIVGPHRDAHRRQDAINYMLEVYGLQCPVEISRIPFIGGNA